MSQHGKDPRKEHLTATFVHAIFSTWVSSAPPEEELDGEPDYEEFQEEEITPLRVVISYVSSGSKWIRKVYENFNLSSNKIQCLAHCLAG